jgi:ABC-2 type transport system ATP-binding protein
MEPLRTEQVCKSFKGGFRLGPLDLRVSSAEVLGIMGPSGAGKTTLMRLLRGFLRPDAGIVSIFGVHPHVNQVKIRRRTGFLSENSQLYSVFTPRQFLMFVGHFYEKWDDNRTNQLLDRFGICPDLKIERLSQAERAKLGLISALGHWPSLVILDEPTTGLELSVRREILQFLRHIATEDGVSVVLSSDITDDLDHIADTVLMLHEGHVVEYARTSTLLDKYCEPKLEAIFVNAIRNEPPRNP